MSLERVMEHLREKRKARRISLREVARRAGYGAASQVVKLEATDANPTLRSVLRYAEAIGVNLRVEVEKVKVISFFQFAGGSSKTTSTRDIGYTLSQMGFRVLLVDTDPQASLSKWLGLEDVEIYQTIYPVIKEEDGDLPKPLHVHGMDILPSHYRLSLAEVDLLKDFMAEMRLRDALRKVDMYDFILIDSPPSLGKLSQLAILASDYVVVPLLTNSKAIDGLPTVLEMVRKYRRAVADLKITLFLLTQLERTRHDNAFMREQSVIAEFGPVSSPITRRPAIYKDAQAAGVPVPKYVGNQNDPAVEEIRLVTTELLEALGVKVNV